MGGSNAGEVASRMAVDTVVRVFTSGPADDAAKALARAVEVANEEIWDLSRTRSDLNGMGTTCTALAIKGDRALVAHVGDSRAYLYRDQELQRLTSDHSVVAELVRRGDLTVEEADRHPQRNVITRALGAEPIVRVDQVEVPARADDVILLCSDGLCALVPDGEVEAMLQREGDLAPALERSQPPPTRPVASTTSPSCSRASASEIRRRCFRASVRSPATPPHTRSWPPPSR
jgi:PPM family protein phosphatase